METGLLGPLRDSPRVRAMGAGPEGTPPPAGGGRGRSPHPSPRELLEVPTCVGPSPRSPLSPRHPNTRAGRCHLRIIPCAGIGLGLRPPAGPSVQPPLPPLGWDVSPRLPRVLTWTPGGDPDFLTELRALRRKPPAPPTPEDRPQTPHGETLPGVSQGDCRDRAGPGPVCSVWGGSTTESWLRAFPLTPGTARAAPSACVPASRPSCFRPETIGCKWWGSSRPAPRRQGDPGRASAAGRGRPHTT